MYNLLSGLGALLVEFVCCFHDYAETDGSYWIVNAKTSYVETCYLLATVTTFHHILIQFLFLVFLGFH